MSQITDMCWSCCEDFPESELTERWIAHSGVNSFCKDCAEEVDEQAIQNAFEGFKEIVQEYGPPLDDEPALCEAWSNYTDGMCKDGLLSDEAYHNCPGITANSADLYLDD